jgi:AraC-like DNA-binding protein
MTAAHTVTVQRMVDLIEKAYANRITLERISAAFRGKPTSLGPLFQKLVGMSVHQYLTQVRLQHAAHLINSGLKIEAVALSVGYQSKKNFYRQFLRHFGVTPEAYRRWQRKPGGRSDNGNKRQVTKSGTVRYAGQFNGTACLIDVETRPNVKGRSSCIATPFVIVDHGIQPFAATAEYVQMAADTEAGAVERAAEFLEHRFGARSQTPKRQLDEVFGPLILAPRR